MPKDILSNMGIDVNDTKVSIDTTKTKEFFSKMQQGLQETAENIAQNIQDGKVDLVESVGVKVDKNHIDVDLYQMRSFIEEIGKKIEHFLASLEHSVDGLSKK